MRREALGEEQYLVALQETRHFRKGEGKAYFSNERTFLRWLDACAFLGAIAAGTLGLAAHVTVRTQEGADAWMPETPCLLRWNTPRDLFLHPLLLQQHQANNTTMYAKLVGLVALGTSILLAVYSSVQFRRRDRKLTEKDAQDERYFDDLKGPLLYGMAMVAVLIAMWGSAAYSVVKPLIGSA